MIERDGLLAYLQANGIEAVSPARDLSRKISATTVDLAYGGYSAVFEGFAIYVRPDQFSDAQDLLKTFESRMRLNPDPRPVDYAHKFYLSCLFTVIFPGFLHVMALYHLRRAIQHKAVFNPLTMFFSVTLFVATLTIGANLVRYYFP